MIRETCVLIVVFCLAAELHADSVVDRSAELETISTDFGLADGPAWDGSWALYFPDVKGQKLYRYVPKTNSLQVLLPKAGRISAAFYSHDQLFLSDNGESQIARLRDKQKVAIVGHDQEANPPIRPNDLVVDKHGGIYYTLTRQGQVMHVGHGKPKRYRAMLLAARTCGSCSDPAQPVGRYKA